MRNALCSIAQIGSDHHAELLSVVLGEFLLEQQLALSGGNDCVIPLAFLQYAFVEILLRRFGTWRPFSENKPLGQQEYLLPTIIWSMLTALGLSLLMFAVTALMR